MGKIYVVSDTHFNHGNIETYCQRPPGFTQREIHNWQVTVKPDDLVVHDGDVFMDKPSGWDLIWPQLPGHKLLVRGNHDWNRSYTWWLRHGFDAVVDSAIIQGIYFTHKPAEVLPVGANLNVHGHLHNIWDGFHPESDEDLFDDAHVISRCGSLKYPWQRLFAIEYTNYMPVELQKFIAHPDKYKARGPNGRS